MGGSPEPSLPLSEGQRLAIVDLTLATELDVGTLVAECTGTVIADGWVLTARHCVPGKGETTRARLAFAVSDPESAGSMDPCGDPARAGDVEVPAARVVRHASLDLALLDLGGAGLPEGVTPIAWTGDAGIEGGQLAGYGLSAGTPGLLFKTERVTAQTEFEITVDAGDGGGACSGDSGGPLLVRDPSGAILVAATLRGGEADCSGEDAFVKVDARWIEAHVGPSASSP